jgi:hypothetical protein
MPDRSTDAGTGEPELSQQLREALAFLRDHSGNNEFRALADDVLAGRRSLVEAAGTAAFGAVVYSRVAEALSQLGGDGDDGVSRTGAPGATPGPCGAPCAGCSGTCAALRGAGTDQPAAHPAPGSS